MSDRDLAPGTVLLGKYRVDEHLGVGGMGRVIRASHLYLQQSVAIKVLLPQMTESPSTVARFLREAQAAVRLKSEHTARVIDVGTLPDGRPYMIMEYLEGNDLNQILRHHGPQQPPIVCDLMLQACEGLAEAHAIGIVHRDIKPSNFFITRRPDGSMLLKILDFGISKAPINYDDNLTQTHSVIGTPSYMAPEQMKSGRDADARSDIWSMGVVMYQLLQGRPPFAADSYAELAIKVAQEPPTPLHVPLPPGFGSAILRCLKKYPNQRHQNVGELARMLAPYASDPVTAAQIATRTTRILQARAAQPSVERGALPGQQSLPVGAGGGLATPIPLSPAALSPRSWPPSPSSTDGRGQIGRSQLTQKTSGGRGWLVAGAMSLTILATSGGYIASRMMREDAPASTPSSATVPSPATSPTPTDTKAATVEAKTVDSKAATVDTKAATVDTKAATIDAKAATVDTKAATVDMKTATVDTKATATDTKAASGTTEVKADTKPATTELKAKSATRSKSKSSKSSRVKTSSSSSSAPTTAKSTTAKATTAKSSTTPTSATTKTTAPTTKTTATPTTKAPSTSKTTKSTTKTDPKKSTDLFNSRH